MRATGRRGVWAIEVLLACVLMALAVLPLLQLSSSTLNGAAFSEAHWLAQLHVQAVLDAAEARGWDAVYVDGPLALPATVPPPALPGVIQEDIVRTLEATKLEDGLVALQMSVSWSSRKTTHRVASMRIVCRPDASWHNTIELPAAGAATAD